MFKLFKKKKLKDFTIICKTNSIMVNDVELSFPTTYNTLVEIFGDPSRKIDGSNEYIIWDDYGFSCSVNDSQAILAVNVYQSNNVSTYVAKKPFKGKLYFDDKDITYTEFGKIGLGKVAIHRLGSEHETRFGFSIGINNDYKN